MSAMRAKEDNIITAASRVFSRYGVKRTTMNDIAAEAGIVRQTLYNSYANKDEVLRATIRSFKDRALTAIETECATAGTLSEKLDIIFQHWAVRPYELLHASPHAIDIIRGYNDAAKDEIAIANERYRVAIETALMPYENQIAAAGQTTFELSDFFVNAVVGFKHNARNKKHLQALLASLKAVILTVAGDGKSKA